MARGLNDWTDEEVQKLKKACSECFRWQKVAEAVGIAKTHCKAKAREEGFHLKGQERDDDDDDEEEEEEVVAEPEEPPPKPKPEPAQPKPQPTPPQPTAVNVLKEWLTKDFSKSELCALRESLGKPALMSKSMSILADDMLGDHKGPVTVINKAKQPQLLKLCERLGLPSGKVPEMKQRIIDGLGGAQKPEPKPTPQPTSNGKRKQEGAGPSAAGPSKRPTLAGGGGGGGGGGDGGMSEQHIHQSSLILRSARPPVEHCTPLAHKPARAAAIATRETHRIMRVCFRWDGLRVCFRYDAAAVATAKHRQVWHCDH